MRPRYAIKQPAGQNSFTRESSLSFWQRYWKAQIDAQPDAKRQETIDRARRILRETHHKSALHDLAACYGIGDGDDGFRD